MNRITMNVNLLIFLRLFTRQKSPYPGHLPPPIIADCSTAKTTLGGYATNREENLPQANHRVFLT